MANTLNSPHRPNHKFTKAAILFAGGPAPAANAVISAAAASFLKSGIDVVGIRNGYSRLVEFNVDKPLLETHDLSLIHI